jgi:hypothetical protein
MRCIIALFVVGSLLSTMASAAQAQARSMQLTLALESNRVWPSQMNSLGVVVQFTNLLNEPLRWHVPKGLQDNARFGVVLERQDGQRFILRGPSAYECYLDRETTAVLAPGGAVTLGFAAGLVAKGDREANYPEDDPDIGPGSGFLGTVPVGEYEVWAESVQGPPLAGEYTERSPEWEVYTSAPVHLSVVPEGTPLAARPRLKIGKPELATVFRYQGVEFVRTTGLSNYGVAATVEAGRLVLKRGDRQVSIPLATPFGASAGDNAPTRSKVAAIPILGPVGFYVPLRFTANALGLDLQYKAKQRLYDLQPKKGQEAGAGMITLAFLVLLVLSCLLTSKRRAKHGRIKGCAFR